MRRLRGFAALLFAAIAWLNFRLPAGETASAPWTVVAAVLGSRQEEPPPAAATPHAPPASPSPAALLAPYGLTGSPLERFLSGEPLSPEEEEILGQLLFYLPRLGADAFAAARTGPDYDALAAAPAIHRLEVVPLRGTVRALQRRPLVPELAQRLQFDHYYQVHLTLEDSSYEAVVFVRQVPAAWNTNDGLHEPCTADALFLKVGDLSSQPPQLLFVAQHLAWLPRRTDPARGIGPVQVALAQLGMDQGLWEDVRAAQRRELSDRDREAFYQALAAVGQPAAASLLVPESRPLDLVGLLEQPEKWQGSILTLEGTARRVMKVAVTDPVVRSRYPLDHYYQIDLFVPLGPETSIRLGPDPTGEKNPVFHNNFPTTLLACRLPPGLEEGENLRVPLRASALFFKVWAYRSPYAARFGQLQPAPLLMAIQMHVQPPPSPTANWVTSLLVTLAMGLGVGMLVLVLVWMVRGGGSSARAKRYRSARAGPAWPLPGEGINSPSEDDHEPTA